MSVFLRPNELHIKDPVTGEYTTGNVIAETSAADQIEAIETAGADQIDAIEDAVTAADAAMEAKAAQTIASIPSDYTTLTSNVASLQERVSALENLLGSNS